MSTSKVETLVKANASKLDKKISALKEYSGQYISFDGKDHEFFNTFGDAVKYGDKTFGESSGFVVRKIGTTPILSNLVRE
jgi:hypothetical protein